MDNIIPHTFAFLQEAVGIEVNGPEAHEVLVYKRQARSIVAEWVKKPFEKVRGWERDGWCFIEYPDPTKDVLETEAVRIIRGTSWWHCLRQIMAELIQFGILEPPAAE